MGETFLHKKSQLKHLSEESTNSGPVGTHEKGPLLLRIKDIAKHSCFESSTYIQVEQLQTQTSTGMKDIGNE
jgi:hypothetical protein